MAWRWCGVRRVFLCMFMFQYSPGNTVNNATSFYKSGFVVEGGLPKDGEVTVKNLTCWLEQADPEAVAEDAFWGLLLYELEDGFFPLMDNPVTRDVGMPEHRYLESERSSEKL